MARTPIHLQPPPADLKRRRLPLTSVGGEFWRVFESRFKNPLFFGRRGAGRFDAPARNFGVCYASQELEGAFLEVFVRTPLRTQADRIIDESDLCQMAIARFKLKSHLKMVDFTAGGASILGVDASLFATMDCAIPQQWSAALFRHSSKPDGILYPSRLNSSQYCLALFERSKKKIVLVNIKNLRNHDGQQLIMPILARYEIGIQANRSIRHRKP